MKRRPEFSGRRYSYHNLDCNCTNSNYILTCCNSLIANLVSSIKKNWRILRLPKGLSVQLNICFFFSLILKRQVGFIHTSARGTGCLFSVPWVSLNPRRGRTCCDVVFSVTFFLLFSHLLGPSWSYMALPAWLGLPLYAFTNIFIYIFVYMCVHTFFCDDPTTVVAVHPTPGHHSPLQCWKLPITLKCQKFTVSNGHCTRNFGLHIKNQIYAHSVVSPTTPHSWYVNTSSSFPLPPKSICNCT